MVYTERDLLAVIELQEERSSFTYEELFRALTEHPSLAVYVELRGSLYGIITLGRIERAYQNHLEEVGINTKFTAIGPDEYMEARNIFMKERISEEPEKRIHLLPVLTAEGKLLGNYTQWDDLPAIEYALPLLKNLNMENFLKRGFRMALVRPQKGFPKERHLFQKLRKALEEKGVFAEVIEFSKVYEYSSAVDYILFCTVEECSTAERLCEYFSAHDAARASFINFRDFIAAVCDDRSKILEYYQEQGVHVLTFDFEENEAGDLKRLENELMGRRQRKYRNRLRPEERKEFLLDLWEQFENQELPFQFSTRIMRDGVTQLRDTNTPFYHIEQGRRLTVEQPVKYDRCVYIFGPCFVIGTYLDDQNTLPSLLQKKIHGAGLKCRVENCGSDQTQMTNMLFKILPKRGDVVVLDKLNERQKRKGLEIQNINLTDSLKSCSSTWFLNMARHCNHKAAQVFADAIYEAILPILQQPVEDRRPVGTGEDPVKQLYLQRYFADFDASAYKTVGSIVMNCNPFTFGHRYLIEEAIKRVDFLLIFVVEEDRSLFTFEERFAMVCAGTADLERVMVVPSGDFILSSMTFPEYFIKVTDEDLKENTESDIILFAERIASELGITHRFVGEEPDDEVTNAYNRTMKRILPLYGIQVVEIPRKRTERSVISASCVRQCLEEGELEQLDTLVPDSTKNIMFYKNKIL